MDSLFITAIIRYFRGMQLVRAEDLESLVKLLETLCLRKVNSRDDKGRTYEFITNNFEISNEEVALIYKICWQIELP